MAFSILLAACGGSDEGANGGPASTGLDAAPVLDAGRSEDARVPGDSSASDASTTVDAEALFDDAGSVTFEAGADSGSGPDASVAPPPEAGIDAGVRVDGGALADAGLPLADAGGVACPVGTYLLPWGECRACASGSYSLGGSASSCTPWSTCSAGEYMRAAGSASADRVCAPCASGTYTAAANTLTACYAWATCSPGQYVAAQGSATTNRVCAGCAGGTFSTASNAASCTGWRTCSAGQYQSVAGSGTRDRTCASCSAGTFTDAPNSTVCAPWSTCHPGYFVQTAGSTSADRACGGCAQGSYTSTSNANACVACAPGTYSGPAANGCATAPELVATTARLTGAGLTDCGPTGADVCAVSPFVSGGTFNRGTGTSSATVADFRLDKYEITVGRFRRFLAAWLGGWRPVQGAGKHVHLNGGAGLRDSADGARGESGWDRSDTGFVGGASGSGEVPSSLAAATKDEWDLVLTGRALLSSSPSPYATWTSNVGANEKKPINFVSWYDLYAFCIWDGGFLPSETEWEYAAAGGAQDRDSPWGSASLGTDTSRAIHGCYYGGSGTCSGVANIAPVGTVSLGQGYWGQMDLTGNMTEVTLDFFRSSLSGTCTNCATLVPVAGETLARVQRSSPFWTSGPSYPLQGRVTDRHYKYSASRGETSGGRCARVP